MFCKVFCFEKSFEYRMRVYALGIFNMLNNNPEMDKFIDSGWIVVQSHLSCVAVDKIRFLLSFKSEDNIGSTDFNEDFMRST